MTADAVMLLLFVFYIISHNKYSMAAMIHIMQILVNYIYQIYSNLCMADNILHEGSVNSVITFM